MDLHNFFPEHRIDEEFVNLFVSKGGFDMLENPINIKNVEVKKLLFDQMQKCMQLYGSEIKNMLI